MRVSVPGETLPGSAMVEETNEGAAVGTGVGLRSAIAGMSAVIAMEAKVPLRRREAVRLVAKVPLTAASDRVFVIAATLGVSVVAGWGWVGEGKDSWLVLATRACVL